MKRIPDQQETETAMLVDYALVALAQLGGIATRDQIIDHVGKVFSDQLTPADRAYVYKGPDGKSAYIPPGYTGGKWEAWAGKTRSALVNATYHQGLIDYHKGGHGERSFTEAGLKRVAMYAEQRLKQPHS
jgi:hypothetical protein